MRARDTATTSAGKGTVKGWRVSIGCGTPPIRRHVPTPWSILAVAASATNFTTEEVAIAALISNSLL